MELIYQNFDKLNVAFQGAFLEHILEQLEDGKMTAQTQNEPALVELGNHEIQAHVQENGNQGGFTYTFDTGPDQQIWMVSKSKKTDKWNIFISVHSMGLALHGYWEAKRQIYDLLDAFEVKGPEFKDLETGEFYRHIQESINRVDYCFDLRTKRFEPQLEHFIAHKQAKRQVNGEYSANYNGKSIETITLGKQPNRQVILYDKTLEIASKGGEHWWTIWNINKSAFKGQIWRVEARAGKNELKKWNIRTFDDLEQKTGDVLLDILNTMRYLEKLGNDSNKGRWLTAPFWNRLKQAVKSALSDQISGAERGEVLRQSKQEIENRYHNNLTGNAIGLAALQAVDVEALPSVLSA